MPRPLARSSILGVVALAAALLTARSASSTVAVPLTFERLTQQADVVVQGIVIDQQSFWGPGKRRIYTHSRVHVLRALKGRVADRVVTVRQLGGAVGSARMAFAGNAALKAGEEVVLFLSHDGQFHYVVGLAQGKLTLQAEPSGRKLATRDLSGITFARWSANGKFALTRRWELDKPVTLDDLESAIKRALAAAQNAP